MTEDIQQQFKDAVNMTAAEIDTWLETDQSKSVGFHPDGEREAVGHEMGRHIVDILHTKKADYTKEDEARMQKVVGYIHRHLAQRPDGDVADTRWRHSLMNWGHDPLK